MATIKSHTDLSQSKTLSKILPLESADMYYYTVNGDLYKTPNIIESGDDLYIDEKSIPCWSLAALYNVLPNGIIIHKDSQTGRYHCCSTYAGTYIKADNPVDACYEMILKLHELKML